MPLIWNPGGGGGISTVHTDNVTISGDGSIATPITLKQVETDATLTGAGTVASPLSAVAASSGGYQTGASQFGTIATPANALLLMGVGLPRVTFSKIGIIIGTPDGANNCDVGLYNAAGTLIANAGAQHMGSGGAQSFAILQGTITIPAGNYYFALTSAANTLAISSCSDAPALYFNFSFGTSAGGALPATITPPAFAFAVHSVVFGLF